MSLYASVCNNTVVMWPLFIELIVSFCVKITQGKQGISFWLECGHPQPRFPFRFCAKLLVSVPVSVSVCVLVSGSMNAP